MVLQQIIESLLPENIKEIQLIKDTLNIFIEVLLEKSDISIDIKNVFDKNKTIIYEEFIKVYLGAIHKAFNEYDYSEDVIRQLKVLYASKGIDINTVDNSIKVLDFITEEHLYTNKAYKSSKGTKKCIEYIYNMVLSSGVQGEKEQSTYFKLEENGLFNFKVSGELLPELYEQYVKALAHPIGWDYVYTLLAREFFTDYFNIINIYNTSQFEMRTKSGETYLVDNYITNLSDGGLPLVGNNTITLINREITDDNIITDVYFQSGERLHVETNPINNVLYNASNVVIKDYDALGNSALFLIYTSENTTSTNDSLDIIYNKNINDYPSDYNVCGYITCGSFTSGRQHIITDIDDDSIVAVTSLAIEEFSIIQSN